MSTANLRPRRAGRVPQRALPGAAALTVALALAVLLTVARPADGQLLPDAIPTWWHEAAGLTPLLTAPPPPVKPTICIIDTGVTPTPDLDIAARWAYDGGTLDDVRATEDSPGHGTLVAHFAAAAVNGWGGAGAFPHARISSVRVFPAEGGASWREYIAAISRCLKLDANTKVIVIAIGGSSIEPGEADELEHWIDQARDLYDVNVVTAAGNTGGPVDFPARFPAAFAVAGSDYEAKRCGSSAYGDTLDLAAPGCGLTQSDVVGTGWALDGTSFAAPIVAAALAAIRSYAPLSAADAEATLERSARAGFAPILDAAAAMAGAGIAFRGIELPIHGVSEAGVSSTVANDAPPTTAPRLPRGRRSRLPRPLVRVLKRSRRTDLLAINRPAGAIFDVRIGARRFTRRGNRVRLSAGRGLARCRYAVGIATSPWMTVRW